MGCAATRLNNAVAPAREARQRKARALSRLDGVDSTFALSGAEMHKLWKVFNKMDADKSGEVSLLELLNFLQQDNNSFMNRVFAIFDEDHSGEVCFREFVACLYNYCTLNKSTLILFAFDLYDADGSGVIDHTEVQQLLREVYGKNFDASPHASHILRRIGGKEGLADGVTPRAFDAFCRRHPALLFPAFQFQQILRKRVLGVSFWERAAEKRVQGRDRKRGQETLGEALRAELSSGAFDALVAAAAAASGDGGGDGASNCERGAAAVVVPAGCLGLRAHIGPVARRRLSKGYARQREKKKKAAQQNPQVPVHQRGSAKVAAGKRESKKAAWDIVATGATVPRPCLGRRRFSTGSLRPRRERVTDRVVFIAEEEQEAVIFTNNNNQLGPKDKPGKCARRGDARRRSAPVSKLATSAARKGWEL